MCMCIVGYDQMPVSTDVRNSHWTKLNRVKYRICSPRRLKGQTESTPKVAKNSKQIIKSKSNPYYKNQIQTDSIKILQCRSGLWNFQSESSPIQSCSANFLKTMSSVQCSSDHEKTCIFMQCLFSLMAGVGNQFDSAPL